jgi:hypothetical protein
MSPCAHVLPLVGVDFTCAPGRRKPIVAARGALAGDVLRLTSLQLLDSMAGFETLLAAPGPWLGAFDFPFGLPREFVDAQALGTGADDVIAELRRRCPTRLQFRALVDAWGQARPPGGRLLHRRTDTALPGVRSSSPLQTRYVPVGFMYYEGFARLVAAGVTVPGLRAGDSGRTALEGYPGWLANALVGRRSYKNRDDAATLIARKDIVDALEQGRSPLGLRLKLGHAMRDALTADAGGDRLDAVLCLAQAAWASRRRGYGVPDDVDPVEGWIVGAGAFG